MQTTLVHPELHIRFALRLSVDHKLDFSTIVSDVILFDKIFQTNDVGDGLLADPNLSMVSRNPSFVGHLHLTTVAF